MIEEVLERCEFGDTNGALVRGLVVTLKNVRTGIQYSRDWVRTVEEEPLFELINEGESEAIVGANHPTIDSVPITDTNKKKQTLSESILTESLDQNQSLLIPTPSESPLDNTEKISQMGRRIIETALEEKTNPGDIIRARMLGKRWDSVKEEGGQRWGVSS
jgi:hypothetical protein